MATFSIKDIEAVSGIKSHTLRIWEQRYGIISPKRTESNIRYYDDEDLKFILNISILNKHGYKISEIAKMSKDEITTLILKIAGHNNAYDSQVKSLIANMLSFDEYGFHKILTTSIIQIGLEQTMLRIVFPFLNEAGILWQIGSIHPSHEHFASNIIKQKLYVAIDGNVGRYIDNRKRFLLFLPEHEQHTLGLLFANFILRSRGHEVLFLGQEVPMDDFRAALGNHKPDYIFTLLTAAHVAVDKKEFVESLAQAWPDTQILLSGSQFVMDDVAYPEHVRIIRKMEDFIQFANSISSNYSRN
ncbi:MAG: MerR family transcriptional regulator [Bacteroidia bacterium]|nr:MerR family transcriptional regulator [Bacteroidia bacterium]